MKGSPTDERGNGSSLPIRRYEITDQISWLTRDPLVEPKPSFP